MGATTIFELNETVSKIIQVERASLDLKIRRNKLREDEKNDYANVKSKISSFIDSLDVLQKESTFQTKKVSSTDTKVVNATTTTGAAEILFDITVTTLATAARATSTDTLFGADYKGTKTTLLGEDINTGSGQDLDPNANVISGSPNFESGGNLSTGSFKVNGETILVDSNDTINTILSKITSSSAGVLASYDASTDKITLENKNVGSTYSIEIDSDNTGFFEKTKLTEALRTSYTLGEDKHEYKALKDTALSSTVTSGYFTINDITFSVDPDSDTLSSIISRINASKAGVSIFYDEESNKVTMTSKVEGEDIVLKNDTSSFLDAINVLSGSTQTYTGTAADVTINGSSFTPSGNELTIHGTTLKFNSTGTSSVSVEADNEKIVSSISSMMTSYNESISTINEVLNKGYSTSQFLYRLATNMRTKLTDSIDNPGTFSYLSEVGISFTRGIKSGMMQLDESKLNSYLDSDPDSVASLFSYDSDSDGLRDDLGITNSLESYLKEYTNGTTGFFDQRISNITSISEKVDLQIQKKEDYFAARYDLLLEEMLSLQHTLQVLQEQSSNAAAIRVDYSLISGSYVA